VLPSVVFEHVRPRFLRHLWVFRVAAIGFQVCQALCEKNSGDWVRWMKVFPGRVRRSNFSAVV
ncbi:hypothetical protein B0H12DRAFT_1162246, partial [Mycena haematopus]